jgi:serine protease inhibitor
MFIYELIKVNDEGTEAAAATAVVMQQQQAQAPAKKPPNFVADHPFLVALVTGYRSPSNSLHVNFRRLKMNE